MNAALAASRRDPRLDFFRGSAMFIIFIAHCRGNFLWDYIPARYGISDAADMFVFLSGMAAAIAFGGTFVRMGAVIGTARILYRCVQLYAAHLGLFFVSATIVFAAWRWLGNADYLAVYGVARFFREPGPALIGLLTLTYVPHYFDILPVYIVVLAMVPVAMLLARVSAEATIAASVVLYALAVTLGWNLPGNADEQPVWFFNPFAWQLIFFTGFALRRGWVRVPLDSPALLWGSVVVLLLGVGISLPSVFGRIPPLDALRIWIGDHSDKTNLDLLQYVHFLASAYVIVVLLRGRERILLSPVLRPFVKCGQQALSVFVSGMVLSHIGGMVFDHLGTGWAVQILVNAASFAVLFAVAYGVAWFKAAPWKRPAPASQPAAFVPGERRSAAEAPAAARVIKVAP